MRCEWTSVEYTVVRGLRVEVLASGWLGCREFASKNTREIYGI